MEDGIEQHSSMLLNMDNNVNNVEKNLYKYVFIYPGDDSKTIQHLKTHDAEKAIHFSIENNCKIEIFQLDYKGMYQTTNTFITPPQLQS